MGQRAPRRRCRRRAVSTPASVDTPLVAVARFAELLAERPSARDQQAPALSRSWPSSMAPGAREAAGPDETHKLWERRRCAAERSGRVVLGRTTEALVGAFELEVEGGALGVAGLGDDHLGQPRLGVLVVAVGTVKQDDSVGVLLQRAGVA